jgi:hypothetical protein
MVVFNEGIKTREKRREKNQNPPRKDPLKQEVNKVTNEQWRGISAVE